MELNSMLDQFPLPDVAVQQMRAQGLKQTSLDDGVALMSGHDGGVAYRFITHQEYNPLASKKLKYSKFNELTLVEWLVDRKLKPVERVNMLPESLLAFDEDGECIGGAYAEAFQRFKQGLTAPGTPLSKWGVLSDNLVASLAMDGIFSVEQFAARPREKIVGKYPEEITEAYERAIIWEKSKDQRAVADHQSKELLKLHEEKEKQAEEIKALKATVEALVAKKGPKKKIISLEEAPNA